MKRIMMKDKINLNIKTIKRIINVKQKMFDIYDFFYVITKKYLFCNKK